MFNLQYIRLLRPHQYVKNLFIFVPLFFSHQITNSELLFNTFIAFVAFSLTASAIYILNDLHDIKEDQKHPDKKNRPLASGVISKNNAMIVMSVLFISGTIVMMSVSINAAVILGLYVLLNVAYSYYLKHIAIIDVTCIASGFVLRLFVGASIGMITLSMWIVVMTFLLALFMALAKRRDDVLIFLDTGKKMRKVIDGYNLQFLDAAMVIMASVVIVGYILYTTSTEITERLQTNYLYVTALFVILAILRYLQITFVETESGSPTRIIFQDRFIQLTLFSWILSYVWIIYL